jgi:hypothetical protein
LIAVCTARGKLDKSGGAKAYVWACAMVRLASEMPMAVTIAFRFMAARSLWFCQLQSFFVKLYQKMAKNSSILLCFFYFNTNPPKTAHF